MNRPIRVRAVILDDDGKLFCVKLKAYGGREAQDFWVLPGGQIDFGESLEQALRREMTEETAVAPKIGNLLFVQQFTFAGVEQMEFIFHVTNYSDYKDFDISKASHAEEEIDEFGFVDPKSMFIMPEFLTTVDLPSFIKNNEPTQIYSFLDQDLSNAKDYRN